MLSLRVNRTLVVALAAAIVATAGVSHAMGGGKGGLIKPNTVGAALAVPFLTSPIGEQGHRITVAAVTNASQDLPVSLHMIWISGFDFNAINKNCELTPEETTYFIFESEWTPEGDTTIVTYECSPGREGRMNGGNDVRVTDIGGMDGIMFVALECAFGMGDPDYGAECGKEGPDGNFPPFDVPHRTLINDILTGDSTILDFGQGMAFSVPAVHIQGTYRQGMFLGDRLYKFTGEPNEYYQFPSLLTTSYIAPDEWITAELLLFTLDGSTFGGGGDNAVRAAVRGFAYDDDENPTSASIRFDCFEPLPINGSPNGFGLNVERQFGGHKVGHLELSVARAIRNDQHEAFPTGNNTGVRRALVHGWILQTISQNGVWDDGEGAGGVMSAPGAWARQLTQGTNPLEPECDFQGNCDIPSLNGVNQF